MARKRARKSPSPDVPALPAVPAGAQIVLVNPGTLCQNCRLPLDVTGYQTGKKPLVVCQGCLVFLSKKGGSS